MLGWLALAGLAWLRLAGPCWLCLLAAVGSSVSARSLAMLTDAAMTTTAAATACDMAIEWHSDRSNMVLVAKLVSCWVVVSKGFGLSKLRREQGSMRRSSA